MKYMIFTAIALLMITTSCNVAYRSAAVNTPLFSEKKELAVTVATNNIQAAYAITDHVGIMANGFYEQSVISNDVTGQGGTGFLGEIGAGYFTTLADTNVIFETYAGAGMGHLYLNENYQSDNGIQQRTLDADGMKFFIQPAIGYRLKYIELSGALRYSNMNYYNIRTNNWPGSALREAKLNDLNSMFHFVEPALTFRAGIRNVKLQFQYIYCIKLNSQPINYDTDVFLLGVFIKLPTSRQ